MTVASNVWAYESSGSNRFGQHGAWISSETIVGMAGQADALFLYAHLKANEGPWARFMILNTLCEEFKWTLKRLQSARNLLIEMGHIKRVKDAYSGSPAFYQWND